MIQKLFCWISTLLAIVNLVSPVAHASNVNVCFYIIGSDLEMDSGAASEDIKEIARADLSDCVHIYLLAGGTPRWHMDMIPDAGIAFMTLNQGHLRLIESWEDVPIGSAEALTRYAMRCCETTPPEHTIIVFWGHGTDASWGVGYDLLNDVDTLTLEEIATGLSDAGLHPDIIGFDACAMATLESCWMLADSCDYLVASTEPENLEGWRHHRWLSLLDEGVDSAATNMAAAYNEECLRRGVLSSMQVIDLRGFRTRMEAKLYELFDACRTPTNRQTVSVIAQDSPGLAEEISEMLDGADFLVGKYQSENMFESRSLYGIGDAYYRWLTTN